MKPRLLPILLLASCVVRYGDPVDPLPAEPLPPPVDFAEVESRLTELLTHEDEHDRIDRLRGALELARRMKTQDPRAQRVALTYLQELVAIEERARPVEAPAIYGADAQPGFSPLAVPSIEEEVLDAPEPEEEQVEPDAGEVSVPVETDVEPTSTVRQPTPDGTDPLVGDAGPGTDDVDALLGQARWMLDEGDALGALTALEVCRGQVCWQEVEALWADARDAHVSSRREVAGERFLAARSEADLAARIVELEAVRLELAELLDRYPDSAHADDIRRNVGLVTRELEAARSP